MTSWWYVEAGPASRLLVDIMKTQTAQLVNMLLAFWDLMNLQQQKILWQLRWPSSHIGGNRFKPHCLDLSRIFFEFFVNKIDFCSIIFFLLILLIIFSLLSFFQLFLFIWREQFSFNSAFLSLFSLFQSQNSIKNKIV